MIETFIPIAIAAASGFAVIINRIHNHMHLLEQRMDKIELRIATEYVSKQDINYALDKIYTDIQRVDEKSNNKCD